MDNNRHRSMLMLYVVILHRMGVCALSNCIYWPMCSTFAFRNQTFLFFFPYCFIHLLCNRSFVGNSILPLHVLSACYDYARRDELNSSSSERQVPSLMS